MAIFVSIHNYKAVFLHTKGVKKNFNPLNSCNPMNIIIELHELSKYCLASGETVFMLLSLNNRIKKIKTYEFDLYNTKD